MYEISKRIYDKGCDLAAVLGMYDKYKTLNQDPSSRSNTVLHLLHEWHIGGGERATLVSALNKIGLNRLAMQ